MRLAFHNSRIYSPGHYSSIPPLARLSGFGDYNFNNIASSVTGASTAGTAAAMGSGSIIAGAAAGGLSLTAGLMALSPAAGPFAPIVAAIAGLVGPVAAMFKGCGPTCTQTTEIANAVADATGKITNTYWAQPTRTHAMQAAAVQALQQLYSYLISNCQKVGEQGGVQCVRDRQPGGKYDYQAQQIQPIIDDAKVVPDPVDPNSIVGKLGSIGKSPLLLIGGGILLFALFSGDN